MEQRHLHGPRWQPRLCTRKWSAEAAWTTDISIASRRAQTKDVHLASSSRVHHRHRHGLRWQLVPWTSTWPQAAARTKDIDMASSSSVDQQQMPWTPLGSCPPGTAQMDTNMASSSSTDQPRKPWTPLVSWPPGAVQTMDTNMASSSSADQQQKPQTPLVSWPPGAVQTMEAFLGVPVQKMNHSLHLRHPSLLRGRVTVWLGKGRACAGSRLLHTPPALLNNSMLCPSSSAAFSHTCHHRGLSSSSSLSVPAPLGSSIFPTYFPHI